ncbi:hypothetical protein BU15DRAFT_75439 [Melanogaster broomeanus]|nr:hypothetical protein BU15DRAFT_75439 [Melanogaster broomeanus]
MVELASSVRVIGLAAGAAGPLAGPRCSLFLLMCLTLHVGSSPTISLHARQLLGSQPITSSPDLTLNTLSHFLDRFVYKNPRKAKPRGASPTQPAASASDGVAVKRIKGEVNAGALPNEEKFWKRKVADISESLGALALAHSHTATAAAIAIAAGRRHWHHRQHGCSISGHLAR